jgi:hypothetical protein
MLVRPGSGSGEFCPVADLRQKSVAERLFQIDLVLRLAGRFDASALRHGTSVLCARTVCAAVRAFARPSLPQFDGGHQCVEPRIAMTIPAAQHPGE